MALPGLFLFFHIFFWGGVCWRFKFLSSCLRRKCSDPRSHLPSPQAYSRLGYSFPQYSPKICSVMFPLVRCSVSHVSQLLVRRLYVQSGSWGSLSIGQSLPRKEPVTMTVKTDYLCVNSHCPSILLVSLMCLERFDRGKLWSRHASCTELLRSPS